MNRLSKPRSSFWKCLALICIIFGVLGGTLLTPTTTSAARTVLCNDGSSRGMAGYAPGSQCARYLLYNDCVHKEAPGGPQDTLTCDETSTPTPQPTATPDGGPGDKDNETPYRCRNFQETWTETYEVRIPGGTGRTQQEDFSEATVMFRVCHNGKNAYWEGYETRFTLSGDASGREFRPLRPYDETFITPANPGDNNLTSSSVRIVFRPYFVHPPEGLASVGVSALGFGINAGFNSNGGEVHYAEYAINVDPEGCYLYTGGGNRQKKCPFGKYP